MKNYKVTLIHTEVIYVEDDNENNALHKAYSEAETNCFWDEVNIEEVEEDD